MDHAPRTSSEIATDVLRRLFFDRMYRRKKRRTWFPRGNVTVGPLLTFTSIPWSCRPLVRLTPVPWSLPIDRFEQSVFAEAFREALAAGFAVPRAIELAAGVNPCPCFRHALFHMYAGVCDGQPLADSLKRSRAWVGRALPDALQFGEELGCLDEAMARFVRQDRAFTGARFRKAIGRSPEAVSFASTLATLLRDRHLDPKVVHAAGRMAGGGRRFVSSIDAVARSMYDGEDLAAALGQYPRHFDRLFCASLARADSREEMRACLERLATAGDVA
jgi:type II secretory pathway component PulF